MNIEEVKSKIKKLLALSADTPYEAESYTALRKAQELMAKYKLSQQDVSDKDPEKCIQKKTILRYGTRSSDHYLNDAATIIANNFCCINYVSTPRGTQSHYICFMGMEDDVEIACEALYTANAAIIRGYDRVYRSLCKEHHLDSIPAKYFNPIKQGYVDGYLDGLKHALESQKEQNQEWGLVLVVPQEAKNFLGDLEKKNFNSKPIQYDPSFYNEGYQDGSNFALNKKLDDAKSQDQLMN